LIQSPDLSLFASLPTTNTCSVPASACAASASRCATVRTSAGTPSGFAAVAVNATPAGPSRSFAVATAVSIQA
jgi:hypothetical protein